MKKIWVSILLSLMVFPVFARENPVNIFPQPREIAARYIYNNRTGAKVKLSDFKGNFTMAVFWSRHCAPCLKELPSLNNFYHLTKDDGFHVILVSPASEWVSSAEHEKFLQRYKAPDIDSFVDVDGDVMADMGVFSFPRTIMINKHGKQYGSVRGKIDWDDEEVIEFFRQQKALSNRQ